jgi:hypothetical protein
MKTPSAATGRDDQSRYPEEEYEARGDGGAHQQRPRAAGQRGALAEVSLVGAEIQGEVGRQHRKSTRVHGGYQAGSEGEAERQSVVQSAEPLS